MHTHTYTWGLSINHVDSFLVILDPFSPLWTILLNNVYVCSNMAIWLTPSPFHVHMVYVWPLTSHILAWNTKFTFKEHIHITDKSSSQVLYTYCKIANFGCNFFDRSLIALQFHNYIHIVSSIMNLSKESWWELLQFGLLKISSYFRRIFHRHRGSFINHVVKFWEFVVTITK